MTITICGSIKFYNDFLTLGKELERQGHKILQPQEPIINSESSGFLKDEGMVRRHMDKIAISDAVLIANYPKNNIEGYIGPNTLMEMAVAFHLKKKIYLLNPVPDQAWKEEVLSLSPIILTNDLGKIR
ncbi:MAG: hypothetical protein HY918_03610 [Candidatus Doudnabacteria bacterium]|nr:hypothetical protein [Candidatus Doudnabacteria bacterium]